jgi:hypothetical protein
MRPPDATIVRNEYTAGRKCRAASAMMRSRCAKVVIIRHHEQTAFRYAREQSDILFACTDEVIE